jgi:hypothetical protein
LRAEKNRNHCKAEIFLGLSPHAPSDKQIVSDLLVASRFYRDRFLISINSNPGETGFVSAN